MAASSKFSATKSKGFYLATAPLTEEDILSMARAVEHQNKTDSERLKRREFGATNGTQSGTTAQ